MSGLFKVVSESGIAAGVRRIEALTGFGTYVRLEEDEDLIEYTFPDPEIASTGTRPIPDASSGAAARTGTPDRQPEAQGSALPDRRYRGQSRRWSKAFPLYPGKSRGLILLSCENWPSGPVAKMASGVVVLALASEGKVSLVGVVSQDLQKKLHAGNIIKKVAGLVGGSGGGRPDFAQAGGKHVESVDQALQAVYNIVAELLN